MKVINFIRNIFKSYSKSVKTLFLLFLLGVLSCGRPFSVLHIDTPLVPLYITEIFILIALPLIAMNFKQILALPKKFLVPLFVYFLFGCLYLIRGVLDNNFFALRDVVLCGYILFLPITFIIFSEKKNLLLLLQVLMLANIIGLIFGRIWMFHYGSSGTPIHFIYTLRTFNLGLYYGIAMSFLIAFFSLIKSKRYKVIVLILLSLNIYISIFFRVRTIWVAGIVLIIFFFLILRRKLLKVILYLIPVLVITFSILGYYDSEFSSKPKKKHILAKGSIGTFVGDILSSEEPSETGSQESFVLLSQDELTSAVSEETFVLVRQEPSAVIPEESLLRTLPSERFGSRNNLFWRLDIWYQAIHSNWKSGWKARLFGKGFGVYPRYVVWNFVKPIPKRIGVDSKVIPTHNHLVSIFYKMGFLSLGLFLFINGYIFIQGLRYIKKCKTDFSRCFLIGSLGAFVFWHTSALFFDIINSPPTSIFLWIIIGFIFSIIEFDKKNNEYRSKN